MKRIFLDQSEPETEKKLKLLCDIATQFISDEEWVFNQ